MFDWFKKKPMPLDSVLQSSGLSRLESTKPIHAARQAATAQPANRKQERLARREMLYGVVREAMMRAGVLSSSYKFKVLSLDTRGRQFLVMVDLAHAAGADLAHTAEIEAVIAQSAKARHDILITAVYWRVNDHVAVGDVAPHATPTAAGHARAGTTSRPTPLDAEHISRPAQLHPAQGPGKRVDPIQPEEVAAFKRALAASVKGEKALAAASAGHGSQHPPQSYALLTGFEDTEMAAGDDPQQNLSGTQYGELR